MSKKKQRSRGGATPRRHRIQASPEYPGVATDATRRRNLKKQHQQVEMSFRTEDISEESLSSPVHVLSDVNSSSDISLVEHESLLEIRSTSLQGRRRVEKRYHVASRKKIMDANSLSTLREDTFNIASSSSSSDDCEQVQRIDNRRKKPHGIKSKAPRGSHQLPADNKGGSLYHKTEEIQKTSPALAKQKSKSRAITGGAGKREKRQNTLIMEAEAISPSVGHMHDAKPSEDDDRFNNGIITVEKDASSIKTRRRERRRKQENGPEQTQCLEEKTVEASFISERKHSKKKFQSRRSSSSSRKDGKALSVTENKVPVEASDEIKNTNCMDEARQIVDREAGSIPERKGKTKKATERCPPVPNPAESALPADDSFEKKSTRSRNKSRPEEVKEARPIPERKRSRAQNSVITSQNSGAEGKDLCVTESDTPVDVTMEKNKSKHRDEEKQAEKIYRKRDKRSQLPSRQTESSATASDETATVPSVDQTERCEASGESSKERKNQRYRAKKSKELTKDKTNEITQPLETTEERFAVEEELETRCARKERKKVSDLRIQPQSEVDNGDDHSGECEILKKANSPPSSAKILPEKCKAARRQHRARKTSQKSSVTGLPGPTSSASSRKSPRSTVDDPKTDATSTIEPSGEEEFVVHKLDTIKPQDMYAEIESSSLESVSIRKEGKIQKRDPSPSDTDAGVLVVRGAFKFSQSSSKTDKDDNQDGYDSHRSTPRNKTKARGLLEVASAVSNIETELIENKEDATICTSTNLQERRKRRAKKSDQPKLDSLQKGQAAVSKVTTETPRPAWSLSKDDTKSSEEMNPDGKQLKKQKRRKSTTTAKESNKADDEADIPSCVPKRQDQIEVPTEQFGKEAKGTKKEAENNFAPEKSESKKADTPNKCEVEEHLIMRTQVTRQEFRPTDSTVLSRNTSSKPTSAELKTEELTSEDDLDDFCTSMFSNSQRDVQGSGKELEMEIGAGLQKKPDLLGDVIEDTEQPLTLGGTPGHKNTEVQPKEEDSTRKEKENEKVDDDKEAPPTDDATLVESDQPSTTAKRSSVWKKITKKPALFKKKKHHASSSNSDKTGVMSKTDSEPDSTNMSTASENETVTDTVAEKDTEADDGRSDEINYPDDVQKAKCKTPHKKEQTKQSASPKETENEAGQNDIIGKESPSPNATMNDKNDTCEQAEELNDNSTEQEPSTKQAKNFEGKKEKKEKKTKIKMEEKERKEKTEEMTEKKKEKKLAKEKKKEEKKMEKEEKKMEKEEKKMEKEEKKKEKAEKKKKAKEEKKEMKEKKKEKKEGQNKEEEEKNKEKEETNKEEEKNKEKEEKKQEKEGKKKGKGKNKEKTMEEKEEMKEKKTQKKEEKKKNKEEKKKNKEKKKKNKEEKKEMKKEKKVEKKEEKKEKNKEKKEEKQAKKDKNKVKEEKKEKKEEKKEKKKQKKEEKKAKKLMKGDDGEIADDAKSTPDGKTKKKRKGLGKLLKGKKVKQTQKSYPTPPASDVEIPAAQPVVARCRMVAPVPATDIKHDLRLPAALVNSDCDAEPMEQETSGKTTSIPASATSELKQSSPEMKAADVTAGWCEAVTTNKHRTTGVQRTLDGQTAIKHVRFADATGTNDVQDETKQNQVSRFQSELTEDSDEWYDSDGDTIATGRKETKSTKSNCSSSSLRSDKSASLLEPKDHPDSKRDTERPIVPNKQSLDSHDDSSSCARLSRHQQRKQMWTEILQELSSPDESPSQPDKAHDILKYDTESKMVIPPGNTPVPSKPFWLETSLEDQPQVDRDDDSKDDGVLEKSALTSLPQSTSKIGRGATIKNTQPCQIESTIIESIKERAKEVSAPSAEHDIMKPSRDEIAPTPAKVTAADTVIEDIENSDSWDDDDEGENIKKIEVKEEVVSKPPSASKQLETDYNSWDEESDQEEEDKKQKKSGKTSKEIDMMDELLRELSPSDDENEFGGLDGRMSRSAFHRTDFIMDQDEETDEPNENTSESTRSKTSHKQQSPKKYKSDELDTVDRALKSQVSSNSKHDACVDSSISTKIEEVLEEMEKHEEQDLTEMDAIEEMLRHSSSDDLFGIVDKMPQCKTSKPTLASKTATSPAKQEETISETKQEANDKALEDGTPAITSTDDILAKPAEQITRALPLTSEPKTTVSATKEETKPMDSSQKVLNSKTNREEGSADLEARTRDESSISDIVESADKPSPLEETSSLTPSHVLESDKNGEVTRKRRITFSDVPRGPTTPGQRRGPLKGVLKWRPGEFLHDLKEAKADHKCDVVNRDALSELADTKSRQVIVISNVKGEERLASYASIEAEGQSWLTEMYPERTDLYSPKTNEETQNREQSPPESESEDSSTTTIDLDADMDDIKWSEAFCSDEEADVSPTKKAGTSRDHIRIQSLESSSESYEAPSSSTPRDLDGGERKLSRALLDGETDVFPPKNAGTARDDIRSPSLESSSESDEAPSPPVHLDTTAEEMKPATNLLDARTQDSLRDSLIRAGKPDSASAFQEAEIPRYLRDDFSPAPEQKPFKRWDPMTAKKKLEKITKSKKKLPESPTPRWLNTDFSPDGSAPKREVWKAPKDKPVLCSTPEAAADNSEFDYASMTPNERYNGRQQIANESQKIIDSMRNQDKFQQSSKTATTPPPSTPSQDDKDLPRFLRADFNPAPDTKPFKKWNPVQAKKTFTKIGNKAKLRDAAKKTASPVSGTQSSGASADTPRWMQPDFDPSKAAPPTARPPPKESYQVPPPQMNTLPQYEFEPQVLFKLHVTKLILAKNTLLRHQ
ncbi:titin homolog [Patiria miniata]|uniref:Uncharacterized protein n=1 Tax=Patiria miniata TaxID=46514 RepID=A0A913ZB26_PATMI|nr:titin homolog [Patiria miniata]